MEKLKNGKEKRKFYLLLGHIVSGNTGCMHFHVGHWTPWPAWEEDPTRREARTVKEGRPRC
jgi:hypothetical protein